MRRDDPPRGPRKPPGSPYGAGGGQRGPGAARGDGGPGQRGPRGPSGQGGQGGQGRPAAPAGAGAPGGGEAQGPWRERGGSHHPHSREQRRDQRARHDEVEHDERPHGRHLEHHERHERGYRRLDDDDQGEAGAPHPQRARRDAELRLYGLNAVRAVFARRPQALRKLYLDAPRIPQLQPLLAWCVANRVGYRVVESADLDKLAASGHHEGVVAEVLREEPAPLSNWLRDLPAGPQLALWLDGVGNPHNLGAILRSAAHFGVAAVLLPKDSTLALSGAAARVAEGGAEAVPMVRLGRSDNAVAQLRSSGFELAATVVDGGENLFAAPLPPRLIYVLGAEGGGMDRELAAACDRRLSIPGTGRVESLNVAAATAVLLAAWQARR
ncbi:TrmH family RNA methyltransferase [Lysobacter enzymogenes]|uniref:TrmH family RNA methyltransferase n=1 Tax=Lysobacter enzymogenes TaxID=69 RepID=UPI0037490FE1